MRYKWLNKKNHSKIILFFNGWGMDESVVSHLKTEDYDVLVFYDYNNLNTDFDFVSLNTYTEKYLVAWSMGVMIATLFDIQYNFKTAINGTLKPIDDKYGIPTKIYDLTLKGFSQKGAERFIKNMYKEDCKYPEITREFDNQKSELQALTGYNANLDFSYDRVIISSDDKIIPTKNQITFWRKEPNLDSGHAPFNHFNSWGDLL